MFYELKQKVESPMEKLFLKDCVTLGIRIEPQVKIGRYRADFAIKERKIIVEIDGKEWHSSKKQIKKDLEREDYLYNLGWSIIRITGSEVYQNGEEIAAEIKGFLNSKESDEEIFRWSFSKQ